MTPTGVLHHDTSIAVLLQVSWHLLLPDPVWRSSNLATFQIHQLKLSMPCVPLTLMTFFCLPGDATKKELGSGAFKGRKKKVREQRAACLTPLYEILNSKQQKNHCNKWSKAQRRYCWRQHFVLVNIHQTASQALELALLAYWVKPCWSLQSFPGIFLQGEYAPQPEDLCLRDNTLRMQHRLHSVHSGGNRVGLVFITKTPIIRIPPPGVCSRIIVPAVESTRQMATTDSHIQVFL